jgi:site-specific DNA-methyltransferase (adenine-specific)
MYRGEFVWDKRIPGLGGGIRYQHENIILLAKGDPSGLCSLPSVLRFTSRTFNESLGHPSKKPEALFRCLLEYCCPAGGIVLDMFAGLGTTILAAETMGRSAIAVELEADYCSAIRRRIDRPHAPPATCANGNDHDTPLFAGLAQTEET